MAYARFRTEGSDVYVYEDWRGFLVCCGCGLSANKETQSSLRSEMIAHLKAHLDVGHKVPQSAFEELESEIASSGDAVVKVE